jgi:hypothetical protein
MPGLHDVVVASPLNGHRYAEALHAELEEHRGVLTLLRDVHVLQTLVLNDEYAITSRSVGTTYLACYRGPDHVNPGALVFSVVPKRMSRAGRRI